MLKVLSIGSDQNLFSNGSDVQKRIKKYGAIFEELHIVVFSIRKSPINSPIQIADNVFIYPTNSRLKVFCISDAYKIGKSLVVNRKLSAITCQDPFESGFIGWLLKRKFKLPLQLQIHADIFSPYFWRESLKNKLRVLMAEYLLPRADGIRVVSERIKQSLVSRFQSMDSRIIILPIFVDVKKIQSAKIRDNLKEKYKEFDAIILMASRLTKEKNIGLAIEAMGAIVKKHSKILLLIIGEGPEKKNLEFMIQNLELDNNVRFEPWTDDLASYYKIADIFLLTSNYEGYGRTVVEAMAAGLPVVMTDVGVAGELLVDDLDGRIIPVGDARQLAEVVLGIMEDSARRDGFRSNAVKLLSNWPSQEEYLEKYKNSLEF